MKFFFACLVCLLTLVGCERRPPDAVVASTKKTYEIVGINQPKHFYVDLRDVETGYVYKHVYVSKHCNAWRKLKMGSQWYFYEVIYQGQNSQYTKIEGVATKLCEALRLL